MSSELVLKKIINLKIGESFLDPWENVAKQTGNTDRPKGPAYFTIFGLIILFEPKEDGLLATRITRERAMELDAEWNAYKESLY